jgi:glutamyl/glutaminyl-tRNA synthetase
MRRVRFPPSPTGSIHVGNALTAAANRSFGDWLLLRIDDTDPSRTVEYGEREIVRDLEWLGIAWDDGPVRQSDRQDRYRAAAERLGGDRFGRITLRQILEPEPVRLPEDAKPTLERFKELADGDARETVRELKGAGGDLHALRLALTGRDRGPELWTVIHALSREEALRRVDAAL